MSWKTIIGETFILIFNEKFVAFCSDKKIFSRRYLKNYSKK